MNSEINETKIVFNYIFFFEVKMETQLFIGLMCYKSRADPSFVHENTHGTVISYNLLAWWTCQSDDR